MSTSWQLTVIVGAPPVLPRYGRRQGDIGLIGNKRLYPDGQMAASWDRERFTLAQPSDASDDAVVQCHTTAEDHLHAQLD